MQVVGQAFERVGALGCGALPVAALIESSTTYRAKVDKFDQESGQYRIVLQGTLDSQDNPFDED